MTTQRTALVTGGGSGIGRAAAELLADQGWSVMITGRREDPLREIAKGRDSIAVHVGDVSADGSARDMVQATLAEFGRLDALVNNAGMLSPVGTAEITADHLDALFRTNVHGPVQLVAAAADALADGGSIVNVTSAIAHKPTGGPLYYAASKSTLGYLTRCWAAELAPRKIRVNAIAPGPTESDILSTIANPEVVEQIKAAEAASLPLKRRGTAAEVARWIVALADPDASWVTGQILAVDGGMSVG
ncbi:SDR family oxidoreductase [Streptomyces sp. NBC_01478]|uniref:SDR family NAD(P)-dependent oxidoreductase n=1 Tax=Streptomyces sp. NBC_01478 TaxID=2903882 RepID=UPI002E365EE1|nr:SDR family oxidoreductase [Streptomyces sp. NBC_01478]